MKNKIREKGEIEQERFYKDFEGMNIYSGVLSFGGNQKEAFINSRKAFHQVMGGAHYEDPNFPDNKYNFHCFKDAFISCFWSGTKSPLGEVPLIAEANSILGFSLLAPWLRRLFHSLIEEELSTLLLSSYEDNTYPSIDILFDSKGKEIISLSHFEKSLKCPFSEKTTYIVVVVFNADRPIPSDRNDPF